MTVYSGKVSPRLRIPFPVKVLSSYLVVVAVGALPAWFYLKSTFEDHLVHSFTRDAVSRAQLLAEVLRPIGPEARAQRLAQLSPLFIERVSYIDANGMVRFDSSVDDIEALEDHSERAEILQALGQQTAGEGDPQVPLGVGTSRRTSATTDTDTVYVAVRVDPERGGIVRLAVPMARIGQVADRVNVAFRNSLAAAISVAILLSLVSAIVFMRPLRKLAAEARAVAEGEYSLRVSVTSNDEVGEVAHAVRQLQDDLRARLAVAEAASSTVEQLVEALPGAVLVLDQDDHLLAANTAARRLLGREALTAEHAATALSESEQFQVARDRAQATGEPQPITGGQQALPLFVHAVPHPAGKPLTVLTDAGPESRRPSLLPSPADVTIRPVRDVVITALRRAGVEDEVAEAEAWPIVSVADAQHRASLALTAVLETTLAGEGTRRPIRVEGDGAWITVTVNVPVPEADLALPRLLLDPIGGELTTDGTSTTVRLAAA